MVDDAGLDRAAGHAAELRRLGVLRERDAVLRLDGPQPSVPSEAVPDRTTPIAWLPRSAASDAEEEVDGQVRPARFGLARVRASACRRTDPTSASGGMT